MTEPAVAPERREASPAHAISYVIARLERAVRAAINERVRPYGLTTLQYTTLSVLGRRGALSNAQLARRSYMTPQSMSEVIEALETQGPDRADAASEPPARPAGARSPRRAAKVLEACDEAVAAMEEEMLREPRPRGARDALPRARVVGSRPARRVSRAADYQVA